MLYQVEQRGRQTAFVGEDGAGLVGLYPLLARAAAIAENENSSFAEALSLAAAERGTPLRRVFADEAEALSHDLGHGGAAEQRAVIDLDNGRIRLEYDHRAGSLRESLDALANHFPTAGANRIQNRLILRIDEEKPEMHISVQGYKVTLCFAEKENPEVAVLVKQALLSAYAMPRK